MERPKRNASVRKEALVVDSRGLLLSTETGEVKVHCPDCNKLINEISLRDHRYNKHGPKGAEMTCVGCSKKYQGYRSLTQHIPKCDLYKEKTENALFPGKCPVENCSKHFFSVEFLTEHVRELHPVSSGVSPESSIFRNIKLKCPIIDGATINLVPQACQDENVDGFQRSVRINFNEMSGFRSFTSIVAFIYKNGLEQSGGVIVRGPPSYKPSTEGKGRARLEKLLLKKGQKFTSITKSPTAECYIVLHKDVTINKTYNQYKAKKETLVSNDQTNLGDDFWEKIATNELVGMEYASGILGNGFDDYVDGINVENLLDDVQLIPLFFENGKPSNKADGIKHSQLYIGQMNSFFIIHSEDFDLGSVNYLHEGCPKIWWVISPYHAPLLETKIAEAFPEEDHICPGFLRHKTILVSPKQLDLWKIPYNKLVQYPGDFVILPSKAYHEGMNTGFNCAQAINFNTAETYPFVKCHSNYLCYCGEKINQIFIEKLVEKYEGSRLKEFEEGKMVDRHPIAAYNTDVPVYNDFQYYKKYYENHDEHRKKQGAYDPNTGAYYAETYQKPAYDGPLTRRGRRTLMK